MTDRARILAVHQSDPDCLARFKAERIDGIQHPNEAAKIGTAVHRACEAIAYAVEEDEDAPADLELQLGVARTAIDSAAADLSMTAHAADEALQIMEGALGPRSHLRFGTPTGWTIGVEVRFALDRNFKPCDADDPKRLVSGTIDRVDWHEERGLVVLRDHKTKRKPLGHDDLLHDWQPRVYSRWALANYNVRMVTFKYVNLRHGYEVGEEFHVNAPWLRATETRIRSLRAAREVALELDTWPETPGTSCEWCPIRQRCGEAKRAWQEGRGIDPSLTPAQIAGRYLLLSRLTKDYENAAKGFIHESGDPIELAHGVALGVRPVGGWKLAEKYLDHHGHVTPAAFQQLLADLRLFHMTPELEADWFAFVREGDLPGAVKGVLHDLLGKHARDFIERGSFIEPVHEFEFGPWLPATGKRAAPRHIDEIIDDLDF